MNADILKKVKVELQSVKGSDLQTLFEARFPDYAKRMKKAAAKGSQHDEYEKIVEEAYRHEALQMQYPWPTATTMRRVFRHWV